MCYIYIHIGIYIYADEMKNIQKQFTIGVAGCTYVCSIRLPTWCIFLLCTNVQNVRLRLWGDSISRPFGVSSLVSEIKTTCSVCRVCNFCLFVVVFVVLLLFFYFCLFECSLYVCVYVCMYVCLFVSVSIAGLLLLCLHQHSNFRLE
jgi:hypothetical protein